MRILAVMLLCLTAQALGQEVETDRDQEVLFAPPSPLPDLGPRFAPVTLDLFQPIGSSLAAQNLILALKVAREQPDLRLVFHPVLYGGTLAERGAEILWEAHAQGRFWPVCELLGSHPELLSQEREQALFSQTEGLGLSPDRLRWALLQHPHRDTIQKTWRRERDLVRYPPELWINGRRLRGAVSEPQLLEEIDRQRERARDLLQDGVPLSALYERALRDADSATYPGSPHPPGNPAPDSDRPPRVFIDLSGSPAQGPQVAPVSLVLFGSADSFSTHSYFAMCREIMQRHPGRVRLVFKHLPISTAGQQAALLLAQLGQPKNADDAFFQAMDALVLTLGRRFQLSLREIHEALASQHIDVTALLAKSRDGAAQKQVERDLAQARRLGLPYAPALFVNGLPLPGMPSTETLDTQVRQELELGLIARICRGSQPLPAPGHGSPMHMHHGG